MAETPQWGDSHPGSPPLQSFTVKVVRPWRRWAPIGLAVAVVVSLVAYAVLSEDEDVAMTRTERSTTTTAPVAIATTGITTTTADPDSACRASFTAANVAGTEVTKFATLASCTEEQWIRIQAETPIPGATLAGLCNARYGLPATSCGTADAERVAREQAAALTTISPPTTTPRPAQTAPSATAPSNTAPTNTPTEVIYRSSGKTPKVSGRIGTGSFTVTGNWTFAPGQIIGDISSCTSTLTIYKPGFKSSGISPVPGVGTIIPTGDFSVSGTFTAEVNYSCPVPNPNEVGDTFSWTLGVVN